MKYRLKKINVNQTSLAGMMGKHSQAGYIIISAFRGGDRDSKVLKQNYKNNAHLKRLIGISKFPYTIAWGGFEQTDENGRKVTVKEQSYIVFNRDGFNDYRKQDGSEKLKMLGKLYCQIFNQDSFFYKAQGENSKGQYINANGKVVMTFGNVSPTQAADIYFTSLNKGRKKRSNSKAFTFRQGIIYLPKPPQTLAEAYMRSGEIFFRI